MICDSDPRQSTSRMRIFPLPTPYELQQGTALPIQRSTLVYYDFRNQAVYTGLVYTVCAVNCAGKIFRVYKQQIIRNTF